MHIWERRNLAYFDRRQRLLAEERQRQEEQKDDAGAMVGEEESAAAHSTEVDQQQHQQEGVPREFSAPLSSVQRERQLQHQQARPAAYRYRYASDNPVWRDMISRNIMGEYDPQRANADPAYHNAWISCQRLVNMNRSNADPNNFIPTNPRLAALLEHRRLEIARERYEEETALRQQQQQQDGHSSSLFHQGGVGSQQRMNVDGDGATSSSPPPCDLVAAQAAESAATSSSHPPCDLVAAQAAEYERLSQAHWLQQRESQDSNSIKSSSSGSSGGEKSDGQKTYYLALPYPTQQLTKPVSCANCNCALYTTPLAKRFFCQTCGHVSSAPRRDAEASYEEKMQDAGDQDVQMSF